MPEFKKTKVMNLYNHLELTEVFGNFIEVKLLKFNYLNREVFISVCDRKAANILHLSRKTMRDGK
jgi:hypothetical protein